MVPPGGDDAGEPREDVEVEMQMKEMVERRDGGGGGDRLWIENRRKRREAEGDGWQRLVAPPLAGGDAGELPWRWRSSSR